MREVSNNDYSLILRLLFALSNTKGGTIREKENARKASLLYKKLIKRNERNGNKRHT